MSQKTIVFESPDRLISLEWSDDGQVLVQDENDSYWWLNPFNGQMVEKQ